MTRRDAIGCRGSGGGGPKAAPITVQPWDGGVDEPWKSYSRFQSASFAALRGRHWGRQLLPTPRSAAQDCWKWRNLCVSLVHSLLTGAKELLGLLLYPQMATDRIHATHSRPGWWYLWVVSCLSTTSLSGHYVGFSVMSLLLELNSACQHLWKLLLLSHQAPSLAFSMANCATHTLFCLVPLGWMSLWLKQIPTALVFFGGTGLVTLGAMIITVGICILVNNVLQSHPHPPVRGYKETRATRTCRDGEPVIKDDSTLSLKD
ncbi:TLC domain-containing protein 2 [Diceros bicornis minor]|uniref:TLC domain-containing protein 2 n=1 Tax=Diceros bicornis minor TaxID=77932 RepID=UPI0026F2E9BF|nr:TLC domain-containing protein 2 [Diceros bicornis minor]